MLVTVPRLHQQQCGTKSLRIAMYHSMYRFGPAVGGFGWTSLDHEQARNLSKISDLRHSSDFLGSPWNGAVERVKGTSPINQPID